MSFKTALVVTSINPSNQVMRELAEGCVQHGWDFIVAGDSKSPEDFEIPGCTFLSLDDQENYPVFAGLARLCPTKSYARKNFGYLAAMAAGATVIVETDDDNHPLPGFWEVRDRTHFCLEAGRDGWVNAYQWFTNKPIYPRGMPLTVLKSSPVLGRKTSWVDCPIQQGLANGDPDVDAIYRMLFDLPFDFFSGVTPLFLEEGAWCPFNSQNTTWFKEAFPLMYLPAYCSFRMCDIWRSFIAQRIMPGIMFHGPTVFQERNEHDLHKDFIDEIPGYVHNAAIREALIGVQFDDADTLYDKMERCYSMMVLNKWIGVEEAPLLEAWIRTCKSIIG